MGAIACGSAASALAAPVLDVRSISRTSAAPGDAAPAGITYSIATTNVGDEATTGEITLVATMPEGVTADFAVGIFGWDCDSHTTFPATTVTCKNVESIVNTGAALTGQEVISPLLYVYASVDPGASGTVTAEVAVYGGGATAANGSPCDVTPPGAPCAETVDPTIVTSEPPSFGIDAFDGLVADSDGELYTQAGGRPAEITTWIDFNTTRHSNPVNGEYWPVEPIKDVLVDLPPGLVGGVRGMDECRAVDLAISDFTFPRPRCSPESQIGLAAIPVAFGGAAFVVAGAAVPVYNLSPPPGVPARFGLNVGGTVITMDAEPRSGGDYGLSVNARNLPEGLAVGGTKLTIWGVPADDSHDDTRACPKSPYPTDYGPTCESSAEETAILRNPTSCPPSGEGLTTTVRVDSWTDPGSFETASFESHDPPAYPSPPSEWGAPQGPTGCAVVPFNPTFSATPTSTRADSPTGLTVELSLPQPDDPAVLSSSDLKRAEVTLPEGMVVNPSSAHGLAGCGMDQIDLDGHNTAPSCPKGSKIGTVEIETPLLDDPLDGSVYLAAPDDNPFGSLLAMYIVAKGPGVVVKLPGRIDADPATGRLKTTFDDQPQLPFSKLRVELFDGPRAALITPKSCGSYAVRSQLTPWARPASPVERSDSFQITTGPSGSACPDGTAFSPAFSAGVSSPLAGAFSPFGLEISRRDGEQELESVEARLPSGLLAKLAGVPLCPQSAITASSASCPAGSRVGSVDVGAGAGSSPFYLRNQPVYLTEGYRGAPYGLAVVTRAIAGPFDLGTVVVRQALHVDRTDAHVTAVSDPFPRILRGIPLDIRNVIVRVDRPGFTRSPSDCAGKQVLARIASNGGRQVGRSVHFQVADCARLGFGPKLRMRLTGRRQTRSERHPGVRTSVTQRGGEAGIEQAVVRLPGSLALDVDNADGLCEFADGIKAEPACPRSSIVGRAKAVSPLLNRPLVGNVYFVKRERIDPRTGASIRTLPMLVVALRGEIAINLRGLSDVRGRKLVTTFAGVPDAPISRFDLNLKGGSRGILVVTKTRDGRTISLCGRRQIAEADIDGHNGRRADQDVRIKTPCPQAGRKSSRRR